MSHYDYEISRKIAIADYPFYGLIMAAIRQADTENLERLKSAFPEIYLEFTRRYNAPAGILPDDSQPG